MASWQRGAGGCGRIDGGVGTGVPPAAVTWAAVVALVAAAACLEVRHGLRDLVRLGLHVRIGVGVGQLLLQRSNLALQSRDRALLVGDLLVKLLEVNGNIVLHFRLKVCDRLLECVHCC